MSGGPTACPDCLRRARLLALLAPNIERYSTGLDRRADSMLRLGDRQLTREVAPRAVPRLLEEAAMAPEAIRDQIKHAGCWAVCRHDHLYPVSLRELDAPPAVLFARGDPELLGDLRTSERAVAIVGARRATSYGREVARTLGREGAASGLTVVSGMAFGIDACAHRGALEAGRTVAVLGCGADVAYPAPHRLLWRRIQESGLVLSELPPGTGAWRWAFPARNRIIAGLCGATVVVEAAERSGSLSTATIAGDLNRPLGAVPGPVGSRVSAGTNALLAEGASVIRDAGDLLDLLGRKPAAQEDPYLLRLRAEAVIGEDRVPTELLRDLVDTYGRREG
jgi:DNA processing protein